MATASPEAKTGCFFIIKRKKMKRGTIQSSLVHLHLWRREERINESSIGPTHHLCLFCVSDVHYNFARSLTVGKLLLLPPFPTPLLLNRWEYLDRLTRGKVVGSEKKKKKPMSVARQFYSLKFSVPSEGDNITVSINVCVIWILRFLSCILQHINYHNKHF